MNFIKGIYSDLVSNEEEHKYNKIFFWLGVTIFVLAIIPRFIGIASQLPIYSIDENELVEFSAGYFGGDMDPHWYKYGPLYSYLLYFVYKVELIFSSLSKTEFVDQVFLDSSGMYYSARFLNSVVNILLGFFTFQVARKYFDRKVALIVFALAFFPFFDSIVNFKIRVDTLLGLCSLLSLYFALAISEKPKWKFYTLCAVFWGLSLASKPLPALLILPTILFAHLAGTSVENGKLVPQLMFKNLFNAKILAFPAIGLVTNFIAHPYSWINFDLYKEEQLAAIRDEGGRTFLAGYDITRFFNDWGVLFTTLSMLACIYLIYKTIREKKYHYFIISSYFIVFFGLFSMGAARDYFYVPVVPVLIIALAIFINDVSTKFFSAEKSKLVQLALLLLILAQPFYELTARTLNDLKYGLDAENHTMIASKTWMEENIPTDSKILFVGFYANLPRIFMADIDNYGPYTENYTKRSMWGEYFMYGRWQNEFFRTRFYRYHQKQLADKDVKAFKNVIYYKVVTDSKQLFEFSIQNNIDYVITGFPKKGELDDFSIFKDNKIKTFNIKENDDLAFGPVIDVYKLEINSEKDLLADPTSGYDYYVNGVIYSRLRNNTAAINAFGKAIEVDSSYFSAYNMKSQMEIRQKQWTEAEQTLITWAERDTSSKASALFNLGIVYFNQKDWDKGASTFQQVSEIQPENKDAYFNAGLCFYNNQKPKKAIAEFANVVSLDPNNVQALNYAGLSYEQINQPENAVKYYKQLSDKTKNPEGYLNIGRISMANENYKDAISAYTKALQLNEKNSAAYLNRAQAYKALNIKHASCEDINKAIQLGNQQARSMRSSFCY